MKMRSIPKEMEVDFALVWAGVEKAWPGRGSRVKKRDDRVFLDLRRTRVSDLSPLRNMKTLRDIYIRGTKVTDLSPLKGMNVRIHR